jgi:hypothetical protein
MTDDWQWFWAGEGGRDRILRDEVEGLHAQLSSATSQTHRLSSQLANLSGSIETRLNALSEAFDAYVELGDVREELAAYAEPAAVRRSVMGAIDALAGGRPATPVDPRGLDYWLPHAMNAVIGLVDGRPDPAALDRARALAPEADTFVVATCGALGHGPAVADLLPTVLVNDVELTEPQQRIWRAAATGTFGDLNDGLAAVWRPALEAEPVTGWASWVDAHASTPADGISWLRDVVVTGQRPDPRATASEQRAAVDTPLGQLPRQRSETVPPPPVTSPTAELRTVATELIGRGMPTEAALLQRSRELRARIEQPGRTRAAAAAALPTEPATVVTEVRRALESPSTAPAVRATLVAWVSADLASVVKRLTYTATRTPPVQETVRAAGAEIAVTPKGVDPTELSAATARLEALHRVAPQRFRIWASAAGISVVLVLVLAVLGSDWAWLFAVAAVAAAIGAGTQLRTQQTAQRDGAAALQRLQEQVRAATDRVGRAEEQRSAGLVRLTGEAAALSAHLPQPVSSADQSVADGDQPVGSRQAGG